MTTYRGKYWVFTLNNYTQADQDALEALSNTDQVSYLVYGREVAPTTNTPHLQGYVIFTSAVRRSRAKSLLNNRAHLERAAGTPTQASDYCKKDGDFSEYGNLPPATRGRRSDWDRFREWVSDHPAGPISDRDLFAEFPGLYARHRERIHEFIGLIRDPIALTTTPPREGWQSELVSDLLLDADDRTIKIYVDPDGNSGKSWMCRYLLTHHSDKTAVISVGKRDDLAHTIDPNKSIFVFDIPRGQMEFFRWEIAEALKNRLIFSPKYQSQTKMLYTTPHVVIFCNELDLDFLAGPKGLTYDRWSDSVTHLS